MIRSARLGRLWAIIVKEMLAALRDPRARITLVVPPILQLVLFGFASTLEVKNIEIGVYDRDGGAWSHEFIQRLAGSPNVARIVRIDSPAGLRAAIDDREVIAALSFDQQFSANVAAGRTATVQALFERRRSSRAISSGLRRSWACRCAHARRRRAVRSSPTGSIPISIISGS
jgi:ABC-2 type transport system permease protein